MKNVEKIKCVVSLILTLMCLGLQAQMRNHWFYCDSVIFNELLWPKDWNHLPVTYEFVAFDTIWSSGKKSNCKLVKNGKTVAFGDRKKNGELTGSWCVLSNTWDQKDFCIWGRMKNGVKGKKWTGLQGFFIQYDKDKTWVGHNRWDDD